ncbi:hypothetical protein LXG23DRAFT_39130 [Yarrowia lipolytica]|uniref:Uncharacterized protein n=1 Tax=Yarrowia lipolytica TaxID=4952 RepID=A0A1D8N3V3_YARLL|nr:hypothetical protein YALI1_A06381g [Yarrowia lipolytica]KAB8280050.1 hypothetical protein BKA91DRAFT_49819 [Yarrowia lipolytica]KAE8169007.1 hypothetical protein BKA90DRAFT_5178 [Yarrowia lipolytica]KAJ8051422.1 hypothetical protein LXG23DRAFT_39130 [Yarrowia lipolytica]RDW24971.1 hypothetical protein B0I71DRAFT_45042 [Yarrowia lipolytica]
MENLPHEIFRIIAGYVEDQTQLVHLACTCQGLYNNVIPLLWTHITQMPKHYVETRLLPRHDDFTILHNLNVDRFKGALEEKQVGMFASSSVRTVEFSFTPWWGEQQFLAALAFLNRSVFTNINKISIVMTIDHTTADSDLSEQLHDVVSQLSAYAAKYKADLLVQVRSVDQIKYFIPESLKQIIFLRVPVSLIWGSEDHQTLAEIAPALTRIKYLELFASPITPITDHDLQTSLQIPPAPDYSWMAKLPITTLKLSEKITTALVNDSNDLPSGLTEFISRDTQPLIAWHMLIGAASRLTKLKTVDITRSAFSTSRLMPISAEPPGKIFPSVQTLRLGFIEPDLVEEIKNTMPNLKSTAVALSL